MIPLLKKPFVVDNVATALTLAPAAGGLDAGPACRFGDGERSIPPPTARYVQMTGRSSSPEAPASGGEGTVSFQEVYDEHFRFV